MEPSGGSKDEEIFKCERWKVRCLFVQQRLLSQRSESLWTRISQGISKSPFDYSRPLLIRIPLIRALANPNTTYNVTYTFIKIFISAFEASTLINTHFSNLNSLLI